LETEIVTPTRKFGESFQTPHELIITASNLRLTNRYEYKNYSDEQVVQHAPDGEQFAFIDLKVKNDADTIRETPNRLDFILVGGDRQYDPMSHSEYNKDDIYEGLNDIVDGVVSEGVQPFQIPSDVESDEISLFHNSSDIDTETTWEVIWE
jgi:hypothetical protein